MEPSPHYTPRERLLRLLGGLAVIVAGCVAFTIGKASDPDNKLALFAIVAIFFGATWVGQGLRGRRDGVAVPPAGGEEGGAGAESGLAAPPPAVKPELIVPGLVAAWLVPGLGHLLVGRRKKALLFFLTITLTFVAGIALAKGRNLDYENERIWFLAYMFNGAEMLLGWVLAKGLEKDHWIPYLQVGFLYSAVACLLNLVAMMDFVALCTRRQPAPLPPAPPIDVEEPA